MYFEIVKNIFVHHTSMINIDKHIYAIVFHLLNNIIIQNTQILVQKQPSKRNI